MRPPLRRRCLGALALVTLFALGGCGSGGDDSPSASQEGGDSERGSTAQSAQPQSGSSGPQEAEGQGASVTFDDVVAAVEKSVAAGNTATFVMTSKSQGASTVQRGEIDYRQDPVAMRVTLDGGSGLPETETIMVGGSIYTKMGDGAAATYLKMSLPSGSDSPLDTTQMDVRSAMKTLAKGVSSTQRLGKKTFGADSLSGFRSIINSQDVFGEASDSAALPSTYVYELWFDDAGAVRRAFVDMGEMGTTEMVYSDWGRPVKITAPPAGMVQEMPDVPGLDEVATP